MKRQAAPNHRKRKSKIVDNNFNEGTQSKLQTTKTTK
jgi:hypothetical protein